ncbi:hypothetical protein CRYUN_Cryun08bG0078600 [Craigia yunnanensis]
MNIDDDSTTKNCASGVSSNKRSKAMQELVFAHGYRFKWIEDEGNEAILSYPKDSVKPILAATIEAGLLKLHQKMKAKVKCDLEKVSSRICLTADFWTSCSKRDYLCLSAHYVNEDWEKIAKF